MPVIKEEGLAVDTLFIYKEILESELCTIYKWTSKVPGTDNTIDN